MGLKQSIKQVWDYLWANHKGATLGVIIAFVLSVAILLFGFWRVVFVGLFVAIGCFIGKQLDENNDLREKVNDFIQNIINKFKKKN